MGVRGKAKRKWKLNEYKTKLNLNDSKQKHKVKLIDK